MVRMDNAKQKAINQKGETLKQIKGDVPMRKGIGIASK